MAKAKYTPDKNGWYSTLVWDGTYDRYGRKHRKQLRTKKSSKELERMVNEFRTLVESRELTVKSTYTVQAYAQEWIKVYKSGKELNTLAMYQNIVDKHFARLKDVKLSDVRRIHLHLLLNDIPDATGRQIYLTFKQVIKSAILDRYLPESALNDIFADTKPPKPAPKEKRALLESEKQAVFTANLAPMEKAYLWIIYGCGLRREEALALTIFDIDLNRSILTVNKALVFDGNNPVLKGTKTENSVRSVPMPGFLTEYLKYYTKWINGTNLFYSRGNIHITKSSYTKMWKRIVNALSEVDKENLRIRELTAHVFRHNYCSNLCYQIPAVSIKKIAQLMGDTEAVVLKVYNHMILEKEDAASAIENALAPSNKNLTSGVENA